MKSKTRDFIIYRYRKFAPHNLFALENNYINGSLFKCFSKADQGEMNYGLTEEFKKKNNASNEDAKIYINTIINNTKDNYYLACFTLNKPTKSSAEWKKYAGEAGFCLSYSVKEIVNAIDREVKINNRILMLDKVLYSNEFFSLDPIAEETLRLSKTHNLHSLEDLSRPDNKVMKATKGVGQYAIKAFFHKSAKYSFYKEVRLVELVHNKNNNPFKDCVLKVKPLSIIVKKGMPLNYFVLEEISRRNLIPIQYI